LVQTSYHQGVLSLLVGTGLPGAVAGFGFMIGMCTRHYGRIRRTWANTTLQRMHSVIYSFFVSQCIIYVFVYGDVFQSFPSLFIYGGILEALNYSNQNLRPADALLPPNAIEEASSRDLHALRATDK
ncbi:MAG: hypothetical protein O3C57_07915, partial [Verrucomicrobia bacterium]|nr:hypothetical protein [Verrucomicrobiota bacterium]